MSRSNIVIFDFDGTLYKGNSFHDFMVFIVFRFISRLKFKAAIILLYLVFMRVLKKISHIEMKIKIISLAELYITENDLQFFSERLEKRLNTQVMKRLDILVHTKTVVVSSAAPCIYLRLLKKISQVDMIHCSDNSEGVWLENKSKVKLDKIYDSFPGATIEELYTDHHDDLDLANESEKVYLVCPSQETVKLFRHLDDRIQQFSE